MDDPYPQDGTSFYIPEVPQETKQLLEDERNLSALASPFIDQVMNWFDEQMQEFDSIDLALYEAKARGVEIDSVLVALNICKEKFNDKKLDFSNLKMNLKKD